jgi:hypothetical protein
MRRVETSDIESTLASGRFQMACPDRIRLAEFQPELEASQGFVGL